LGCRDVLLEITMSLYDVQRTAQQPSKVYLGRRLAAAITRWFDRERELIRLRVAMGMMSEARQSDAREHAEMFQRCRELAERVRQLEVERDAWRSRGDGERLK
jgi:hypothetical protein